MHNIEHKRAVLLGVLICLLAVIIGAFGSHALADLLANNQRTNTFELANRYQFYHGIGLLALAALCQNRADRSPLWLVELLMVSGVVVFCGSLYGLAITNISVLGAITPIGGGLLIGAWAVFAWQLVRG